MLPTVHIYAALEDMQAAAAHYVADVLAPTTRGHVISLALSGGSTPRRMHEILAALPDINWAQMQVFWGDERTVPPDDAQSNYGMARDSLLSKVAIPPHHIHRMQGELEVHAAAERYEREMQQVFSVRSPDVPHFDLTILGIGADGHTASLFPNTAALTVSNRWVVANWVPQQNTWRITLTYPVLKASKHTVFLAAGADKADALYRVFSPRVAAKPPSADIILGGGHIVVYLDEAAGAGYLRAMEESASHP